MDLCFYTFADSMQKTQGDLEIIPQLYGWVTCTLGSEAYSHSLSKKGCVECYSNTSNKTSKIIL